MLQNTRYPPDDPREWLNRARSSLRLSETRLEDVYLDDLCYHAQQAAEKAIKAVLITRNVRFPYVHDLSELLDVADSAGWKVPARIRTARELTKYATGLRYPNRTDVDEAAYIRAVDIAREVVAWATTEVRVSDWDADRVRERVAEPYVAGPALAQRGDRIPDVALVSHLVQRIVEAATPDRIILFGSASRGTMGPHSDLDLMVVKSGAYDELELGAAIRGALSGIGIAFDVIVVKPETLERFGHSWALVYRPALEEGMLLYDASAGDLRRA